MRPQWWVQAASGKHVLFSIRGRAGDAPDIVRQIREEVADSFLRVQMAPPGVVGCERFNFGVEAFHEHKLRGERAVRLEPASNAVCVSFELLQGRNAVI